MGWMRDTKGRERMLSEWRREEEDLDWDGRTVWRDLEGKGKRKRGIGGVETCGGEMAVKRDL